MNAFVARGILYVLFIPAMLAYCQAIHPVMVGDTGSFYNTPTTSALTGDIVRFIFSGQAHSVTQSSADAPCVPLPGGFNSGINGIMKNPNGIAPTWDLIINTTDPIWFYCQASIPSPHCEAGMVGVINPPSQAAYLSYVSAAKALTFKPTDPIETVLTGSGAFATAPPTVTSTSTTSTQSSPMTSTPTGQSSGGSHVNGAIVGGAVGGGVAVVIVLSILAYCLVRSRQRDRNVTPYPETAYRPHPSNYEVSGTVKRTALSDPEAAGALLHSGSPPVTATQSSFDAHTGSRSHSPGAGRVLTTQPSNATFKTPMPSSSGSDSYEDSVVSNRALYTSSQPGLGQPIGGSPPVMLISQQNVPAQPMPMQQRIIHPYSRGGIQQMDEDDHMAHSEDVDYQTRNIAREVASLLEPHLRSPSATAHQPLFPQVVRQPEQQRPVRQLPDPVGYSQRTAAPPQYKR